MDRIFNMDNKFFTFMSRVADLIILNLLFLVCCIPIITIGPALTAMNYVTLKMARNEESYIARAFFKSFRQNFKQGIIIWFFALVMIILEMMDFFIMRQLSGGVYTAVKYGLMIIALLLAMVMLYVFPVLAKFDNTVKNTIRNALLMCLRHLPYTILMLVITIAPLIAMIFNATIFSYGILAYFLLGFSTIALINSYFFAKIFDNYIPHDDVEEEKSPDDWTIEGMEGEEQLDGENAPELEDSMPDDNSEEENTESCRQEAKN